eukprot:1224447-Rhodomonas_salina.1
MSGPYFSPRLSDFRDRLISSFLLVHQDAPLFISLISDLFPGITAEKATFPGRIDAAYAVSSTNRTSSSLKPQAAHAMCGADIAGASRAYAM